MYMVNPSKRVERAIKGLALLLGISCGCFYASFSRSGSSKRTAVLTKPFVPVTVESPKPEINETAAFLVSDDTTLADNLAASIKVLCWNHMNKVDKKRIEAIKKTWGRKCSKLITITSSGDNSSDVFNISKNEGQESNIENAYRFINKQYGNDFDWFLRTDGSVFVVMENLRYKLYAYNPDEPIGIGLKKIAEEYEYFSDKAGYVLSKSALNELINGFESKIDCMADKEASSEEIRFGRCLEEVGIIFGNSTDDQKKQQFFDKYLDDFLLPDPIVKLPYPWYQDYKVNHYLDSASNYSITFSNLSWQQMHVMEYLIYQLRPYGIETITPPLPEKISLLNVAL